MKQVVRTHNEAINFVDRACIDLGMQFEKPQMIEIKRFKPPRTLPQNAMLHAMVRELATEIGYSEGELMDYFKSSFGPQKIVSIMGVEKSIPLSTTEYTREQMSEMIGHVERVGAEMSFRFTHE